MKALNLVTNPWQIGFTFEKTYSYLYNSGETRVQRGPYLLKLFKFFGALDLKSFDRILSTIDLGHYRFKKRQNIWFSLSQLVYNKNVVGKRKKNTTDLA